MAKECLIVSRPALEQSGFIPENMTDGFKYTRVKDQGELIKLLRLINKFGQYSERHGERGVDTVYYPDIQQPIIYAFVAREDGKFLLYQRGGPTDSTYTEGRLAGKVSVGIGGHMEPTDLSLPRSFYREMEEESDVVLSGSVLNLRTEDGDPNILLMKKLFRIIPVGLIKDERTTVDRDHFGIVCKVTPTQGVEIRVKTGADQENSNWQYVSPEEYRKMQESGQIQPENWTDIVFNEELDRA